MSMTRPLSRITLITSARLLGAGRSKYRLFGRCCVTVMKRPFAGLRQLASGRGGRRVLLRALQEVLPDVRAICAEGLGNRRLVGAGEVADAPVELLEGVFRRGSVAINLMHQLLELGLQLHH